MYAARIFTFRRTFSNVYIGVHVFFSPSAINLIAPETTIVTALAARRCPTPTDLPISLDIQPADGVTRVFSTR